VQLGEPALMREAHQQAVLVDNVGQVYGTGNMPGSLIALVSTVDNQYQLGGLKMKNIKFNLICFYFNIKPGIKNSIGEEKYPIIFKKFKERYHEIDARVAKEKGIMAFHRVFLIIGLALYKALHDEFQTEEELIDQIHEILMNARMFTMIRVTAFLIRKTRNPFEHFLKQLGPRNEWFFPCPPWEKVEVELKNGIGWQQKKCPHKDFFEKEGVVELTRAYCDMDKRIAALVPDHIELKRQHTLANGDGWCDFYYYRKELSKH